MNLPKYSEYCNRNVRYNRYHIIWYGPDFHKLQSRADVFLNSRCKRWCYVISESEEEEFALETKFSLHKAANFDTLLDMLGEQSITVKYPTYFMEGEDQENDRSAFNNYRLPNPDGNKVFKSWTKDETLLPWQEDLINLLTDNLKDTSDREIYSIVNESGNVGKSWFVKYLLTKSELDVCIVPPFSSDRQAAQYIRTQKPARVYVFDLPRQPPRFERMVELSQNIEMVKNGILLSSMYGGQSPKVIDPPQVVIFSNYLLYKHLFSEDRVKIFNIESKDSSLIPQK